MGIQFSFQWHKLYYFDYRNIDWFCSWWRIFYSWV